MPQLPTWVWASIHAKPSGFFRVTLLSADSERIKKLFESYEEEVSSIKSTALSMAWNMRGGASYEDILNMSSFEREQISKLIEEHMEVTKKSQLPYF